MLILLAKILTICLLLPFRKNNTTMTILNELNAISPIDGRYRSKTISLAPFFSEEALIKYRVLVEIEYFIALCEVPLPQLKSVNPNIFEDLRAIYRNFSTQDALWIKETEKVTNHDVKAVEYFIKDAF
jgi:adenylosuccinate lyase